MLNSSTVDTSANMNRASDSLCPYNSVCRL